MGARPLTNKSHVIQKRHSREIHRIFKNVPTALKMLFSREFIGPVYRFQGIYLTPNSDGERVDWKSEICVKFWPRGPAGEPMIDHNPKYQEILAQLQIHLKSTLLGVTRRNFTQELTFFEIFYFRIFRSHHPRGSFSEFTDFPDFSRYRTSVAEKIFPPVFGGSRTRRKTNLYVFWRRLNQCDTPQKQAEIHHRPISALNGFPNPPTSPKSDPNRTRLSMSTSRRDQATEGFSTSKRRPTMLSYSVLFVLRQPRHMHQVLNLLES